MDSTQTAGWSMGTGPDDFSNLLDFSDLDFPPFENGISQNEAQAQNSLDVAMDTTMVDGPELQAYHDIPTDQQLDQSIPNPLLNGFSGGQGHLFDLQTPTQFSQPVRTYTKDAPRLVYAQGTVPPTPNSIELHGGHPAYYQVPIHQQAHTYGHYQRNPRDQMIFTPLVSPAVTPHDAQTRYSEFATSGDHFSPLTSPAMEAQHQANQASMYAAMRSDTSDTTSPIDLNREFNPSPPMPNANPVRRTRRKTIPTQKNPARSVKQSPAMKPQSRRKQPSSTTIPPKEVSGIIEEARKAKEGGYTSSKSSTRLPLAYTQDSSGTDSISPEPLSEVLMPPPATPKSNPASQSPFLNAMQSGAQSISLPAMAEEPATPASLMRIRKQAGALAAKQHEPSKLKEQAALIQSEHEQIMEDIPSPESTKFTRPVLAPIKTGDANDDQATPKLSGQQTPRAGTTSAPLTATSSVFPSPQLRGLASPSVTGPSKRPEGKGLGRDTKRRNNSNSVQASPALRPRISPSIKPLLPEGTTVSPETSALLLASKSNYQNILEGTHLPGVSYPENLSTNLTSKRTSHKLAEQGRRNRINTALSEMASLLPPAMLNANEKLAAGGCKDAVAENMTSGSALQQANSKARTVEVATEYIKILQQKVKDAESKLGGAEQQAKPQSDNS